MRYMCSMERLHEYKLEEPNGAEFFFCSSNEFEMISGFRNLLFCLLAINYMRYFNRFEINSYR